MSNSLNFGRKVSEFYINVEKMSHFRLNDDFFSPIRLDSSTVDDSIRSSEGSFNDPFNFDEFSSRVTGENKNTLEKNVSAQENELKAESKSFTSPESMNTCSSVFSSDTSNIKRQSSRSGKLKDSNTSSLCKEKAESQQKKQTSLHRENILDNHTPKSNVSDKLCKKKSRSSSLCSRNEDVKEDRLKNVKKRQKDSKESSKCKFVDEETKANIKLPSEKKLTDCSLRLPENSLMSTKSKENSSANLAVKTSSNKSQEMEKGAANSQNISFEASIEKIVCNCITRESAKLRQHIYMQQMSFYREMNKIKDEMEKQHLVTTERLFKVIEELMQMNASLQLALSTK